MSTSCAATYPTAQASPRREPCCIVQASCRAAPTPNRHIHVRSPLDSRASRSAACPHPGGLDDMRYQHALAGGCTHLQGHVEGDDSSTRGRKYVLERSTAAKARHQADEQCRGGEEQHQRLQPCLAHLGWRVREPMRREMHAHQTLSSMHTKRVVRLGRPQVSSLAVSPAPPLCEKAQF